MAAAPGVKLIKVVIKKNSDHVWRRCSRINGCVVSINGYFTIATMGDVRKIVTKEEGKRNGA